MFKGDFNQVGMRANQAFGSQMSVLRELVLRGQQYFTRTNHLHQETQQTDKKCSCSATNCVKTDPPPLNSLQTPTEHMCHNRATTTYQNTLSIGWFHNFMQCSLHTICLIRLHSVCLPWVKDNVLWPR